MEFTIHGDLKNKSKKNKLMNNTKVSRRWIKMLAKKSLSDFYFKQNSIFDLNILTSNELTWYRSGARYLMSMVHCLIRSVTN